MEIDGVVGGWVRSALSTVSCCCCCVVYVLNGDLREGGRQHGGVRHGARIESIAVDDDSCGEGFLFGAAPVEVVVLLSLFLFTSSSFFLPASISVIIAKNNG